MKPMLNPRFMEARRLRTLGHTYKDIGEAMGMVSAERARQMVIGADRREQLVGMTCSLSVLAYNCLMRMFGHLPSKAEMAATSDTAFLREKGLGRKTLKEIRDWQNRK